MPINSGWFEGMWALESLRIDMSITCVTKAPLTYNSLVISIDLPEPQSHRMELVGDTRREKGAMSILEVTSSIELNEPQSIRLSTNPVWDDKELEQFLAANDGTYRYDYVRLGCTFVPSGGERFEKAWLNVDLKSEGNMTPVSWSIFPLSEFDTTEESVSAKIGSDAKIIKAEIGASSKIAKKLFSVRGYREGKSNPFWELYSTGANTLDGSLRFHMIVRSAAATPTVGSVRLEAVISNKSYVVFREKRPFDQSPSAQFTLPAAPSAAKAGS